MAKPRVHEIAKEIVFTRQRTTGQAWRDGRIRSRPVLHARGPCGAQDQVRASAALLFRSRSRPSRRPARQCVPAPSAAASPRPRRRPRLPALLLRLRRRPRPHRPRHRPRPRHSPAPRRTPSRRAAACDASGGLRVAGAVASVDRWCRPAPRPGGGSSGPRPGAGAMTGPPSRGASPRGATPACGGQGQPARATTHSPRAGHGHAAASSRPSRRQAAPRGRRAASRRDGWPSRHASSRRYRRPSRHAAA